MRVIRSANGQLETVIQRFKGGLPSVVLMLAREGGKGGGGVVVRVLRVEIRMSMCKFPSHDDPRTDESQQPLIGFKWRSRETTDVIPSVQCLKAENLVLTCSLALTCSPCKQEALRM